MAKRSFFETLLVGAAKTIDKSIKESQKERERQRKLEEREQLKRERERIKEMNRLSKLQEKNTKTNTIDISNR